MAFCILRVSGPIPGTNSIPSRVPPCRASCSHCGCGPYAPQSGARVAQLSSITDSRAIRIPVDLTSATMPADQQHSAIQRAIAVAKACTVRPSSILPVPQRHPVGSASQLSSTRSNRSERTHSQHQECHPVCPLHSAHGGNHVTLEGIARYRSTSPWTPPERQR